MNSSWIDYLAFTNTGLIHFSFLNQHNIKKERRAVQLSAILQEDSYLKPYFLSLFAQGGGPVPFSSLGFGPRFSPEFPGSPSSSFLFWSSLF